MLGGLRTSGQYHAVRKVRLMSRTHGFTIVETMIVLAVTGLLLSSAMIVISGKQNQAAFNQSIRQIQSQIQQRINEVATGYYANQGNIRCIGGGGVVTLTQAAGTEQGANAGCIFLGKVMQFKVASTDPEQFKTFSVAALQKGGVGGAESSTLALAKPKAIAPPSADITGNTPDATETQTLQNGLTTYRMWYNNGAGNRTIGSVAFVMSLAQFSSNGAIASGSQQIDVVPIDDGAVKSKLDQTQANMVDAINSGLPTATVINPTGGVFICFVSGGTNQSGLITIGNQNRQLSVKLDIKGNTTCS
jgi:prepilin-type N-terminal cleavage/methylation domain-containing protein